LTGGRGRGARSRRGRAAAGLAALIWLSCGRVEQPNIIFIMADDLGWGDLGVYGSELGATPRLDRMAAEGTRFTQVYAGGSVCGPSRCVLMTGLHGGHCVLRDNLSRLPLRGRARRLVALRPQDVTVAALLKAEGYATAGVGKWGLGDLGTTGAPALQGFDTFFGYLDQLCAHDHYPESLIRDGERIEIPENAAGATAVYAPDLFAEEMLKVVETHRDEPFFLYAALTLPHLKWEVPALGRWEHKEGLQPVDKVYAAMLERLDDSVGRLLDRLGELGLDKRTIVFFTSDNGSYGSLARRLQSNRGLRGQKSQIWEGGIRVPMVVRWPGRVPAGRVSDAVWSHVDFLPTALELAGGAVPAGLDGESVLRTLRGRRQEFLRPLYWEIHRPFAQAVRQGRYKGVRFGTREPVALYDLEADPGETTDVALEHPGAVREIESILDRSRTETPHWPAAEKAKVYRRSPPAG